MSPWVYYLCGVLVGISWYVGFVWYPYRRYVTFGVLKATLGLVGTMDSAVAVMRLAVGSPTHIPAELLGETPEPPPTPPLNPIGFIRWYRAAPTYETLSRMTDELSERLLTSVTAMSELQGLLTARQRNSDNGEDWKRGAA